MALNHIQITNAKPRDKAYKLADSDGLYLFIQPNGAKLWRMNYRHLGRQKTLYFGAWPEVGIAAARQLRDKAREQIAAGLDPAAEKRVETLARKVAADNTFKTIAEEWVAKNEREGRAPITLDKIRWLLGMAYPMIGTLPISKITPQEVLAVLRKVEATGRYESARRMRSVLSRVFRYGIATARADRDVAADLRGALITPKVQHLAAITTPKEAGGLLRAIEGYTGHEITAIALRLSPHLFVRPGELRSAEWTEFDTQGQVWSLPGREDEDAAAASGAALASGARYARRSPRFDGRWAISLPVVPLTEAVYVREHNQRGAPATRLQPGRDDRARLPRDGSDPAQRNGHLEPGRYREAARPSRHLDGSPCLHAGRILGRARPHDAALVRLSRPAPGRCEDSPAPIRKEPGQRSLRRVGVYAFSAA